MNALHASFSHYLELYITHIARFISPTLMLLPLKTHNTVSKRKKTKRKAISVISWTSLCIRQQLPCTWQPMLMSQVVRLCLVNNNAGKGK